MDVTPSLLLRSGLGASLCHLLISRELKSRVLTWSEQPPRRRFAVAAAVLLLAGTRVIIEMFPSAPRGQRQMEDGRREYQRAAAVAACVWVVCLCSDEDKRDGTLKQ